VLDGGPRTATAAALERTSLLKVMRVDLLAVLRDEPTVAAELIALLCDRLRWMNRQVEDFGLLNVPARLASRLIILDHKLADDSGVINISQGALADFLGSTRESINKTLRSWQQAGLIELRRGAIHLVNTAALAEIAADPT